MKLLDYGFNYKRTTAVNPSTGKPIIEAKTGKPMEFFHPVIPLIVSSGKKRSPPMDGLLDSGSDGVVLPKVLADYLGLELRTAETPMRVADGKSVERYISRANLTIGRAGRYCDPIDAEVTVPALGKPPILIGRDPIFSLFVITFIEAEKRIGMKPYRPG
ncbi:MAG: hypothetical protein A3K67_06860 [Euryarchaeota archaeon RBG_16_62_10]|nr:MAG: hypothetical protein A3K67_06860 [Euryarchaeota archaeon RBG_16_62_10]